MEYLIQHGCDVNKTDINNVSALHIACQKGNYDAVRLLLNGDFLKINIILVSYDIAGSML